MFVSESVRYEHLLIDDLPYMLPTKFRFIWKSGFRKDEFKKNYQSETKLHVAAMFVNRYLRNVQSL
jgi:hypothetical protein